VVGFALSALCYYGLSDRAEALSNPAPPLSLTGAPGEGTCVGCHYTYAGPNFDTPNLGPGDVRITGLPAHYMPGQTYNVTVTLTDPAARRWGFEITAVDDSGTSATVGSLEVADPSTTVKRTGEVLGKSRTYVSHNQNGTFPGRSGSNSWSFSWTAPAAGSSEVTFYAAGNAANNQVTPENDYIYTTLALVKPPAPVVAARALTGLSSYLSERGAAAVELRARGNFDGGARVVFNGVELPTQATPDGLFASVPAELLAGRGVYPVRVKLGSGELTNPRNFVVAAGVSPDRAVTATAADYARRVAPGGIAAVFGKDLVAGGGSGAATTIPLPLSLRETMVYVDGVAAPLFFASGGQINCQVPYGTAVGQAAVVVVREDGMATRGVVNVYTSAPAVFTADASGQGQASAQNSDYSLNGDPAALPGAKRARKGDFVILYGAGAGGRLIDAANGEVLTIKEGEAAGSPLPTTASSPVVTIGGRPATVYFSGLAPGLVGLWQINLQVPPDAPSGKEVGVSITFGGQTANGVRLAVE